MIIVGGAGSRYVLFELLNQKGFGIARLQFLLSRLQAIEFRLWRNRQRRQRMNLDDVGRIPLQTKKSLSHLNLTTQKQRYRIRPGLQKKVSLHSDWRKVLPMHTKHNR